MLRLTGELADLAQRAPSTTPRRCWPTPAGRCARVTGRQRGRLPQGDQRAGHPHRPGRAGGGADPSAGRRENGRLGHPAGQPARPRRPADREGPARQAGRVRLQGPGRRQRGRAGPRLRRQDRQPARRRATGPGDQAHLQTDSAASPSRWPPTAATARPASTRNSKNSASRPWSSPAKANPARPAKTSSTHPSSANSSSGAPDAEGRISHLKRRYGWDRSLVDGRRPHRNLVRLRSPRPQPRQGRPPGHPERVKQPTGHHQAPEPERYHVSVHR